MPGAQEAAANEALESGGAFTAASTCAQELVAAGVDPNLAGLLGVGAAILVRLLLAWLVEWSSRRRAQGAAPTGAAPPPLAPVAPSPLDEITTGALLSPGEIAYLRRIAALNTPRGSDNLADDSQGITDGD